MTSKNLFTIVNLVHDIVKYIINRKGGKYIDNNLTSFDNSTVIKTI